jgi:hypothetical protein
MRLSANRIRSINRTLASINGRSLYNDHEPLAPAMADTSHTHVVFVPASRL